MNGRRNRRLRLLCLPAAAAAVAAILWAETQIWRSVALLRQRAETVSSDGFHLSDHIEARLRELHEVVSAPASADPAAIRREAEALGQWLAANREVPVQPALRELMGRATTTYERYRMNLLPPVPAASPATATAVSTEEVFRELLLIARQLNEAERAALSRHLAETRTITTHLQTKLLVSSAVLIAMGAVAASLVYIGLIAPLRQRLEDSQRVIERQEKMSSLGVLAAGVAHEIRNPLTSIKARLFTQQSWLGQSPEALEDNEFITGEISRLEKIVRDFLAFARPSDPRFEPLRATQPLRDIEAQLRPGIVAAGLELKTEYLADPPILADPQQLKQVLLNLVQNAAESLGHSGTITLRTRAETRNGGAIGTSRGTAAPVGKAVAVLEVHDTGPGIPPDVQKRLFDPFFTTKASGTGLGLSIAARILEKHGGSLEFQTAPDRGTAFRILLPITLPAA